MATHATQGSNLVRVRVRLGQHAGRMPHRARTPDEQRSQDRCTPGKTGSWAPATLGRSDEWLAVYFDQPVYTLGLGLGLGAR
eukprot:scaffold57306_cov36-Phaeocystis_antarctica.AAC.1